MLARLLPAIVLAACAPKDRIRADVLADALAENPDQYYLVDVRSSGEFHGARGHLPGAVSLPWPAAVRDDADTLAPGTDQTTVLICFTGHRSRWSMRRVREAVDTPVVDLQGGMIRWWAGEHPVVVEPND